MRSMEFVTCNLQSVSLSTMATKVELISFGPEELRDFLVTKFGPEVSMESLDSIKNNKIGGMTFLELTSEHFK